MWTEKVIYKNQTTVLFIDYETHRVKAPDNHPHARDKVIEQFSQKEQMLQWLSLGNNDYLIFRANKDILESIYKDLPEKALVRIIPYGLALWTWCVSKHLLTDECVLVVDVQGDNTLLTIVSKNYISPTRKIVSIHQEQLNSEIIRTVKYYESQFQLDFSKDLKILNHEHLNSSKPAQEAVEWGQFNINFRSPQAIAKQERFKLIQKRVMQTSLGFGVIGILAMSGGYPLWAMHQADAKIKQYQIELKSLQDDIQEQRNSLLIGIKNQQGFNLNDFVDYLMRHQPIYENVKQWQVIFDEHGFISEKTAIVEHQEWMGIFDATVWGKGLKDWRLRDDNGRIRVVLSFD